MKASPSLIDARIASARANRNRRVVCERYVGRVSQTLIHSIRVDDRRGNLKESIGQFDAATCPLCHEASKGVCDGARI